jgi:hypothetical protein
MSMRQMWKQKQSDLYWWTQSGKFTLKLYSKVRLQMSLSLHIPVGVSVPENTATEYDEKKSKTDLCNMNILYTWVVYIYEVHCSFQFKYEEILKR